MAQAATTVTPVEPTKDQVRDELADQLVSRYAAWAAAAGVIPVPALDVVAVGGVQLQMLRKLTEIYEVPFSDNMGKSVIASTIAAILPVPAAAGLASAMKFVPVVGTAVGSLSMPAAAAGATYALGKVFILHFASGGTLLDFDVNKYTAYLKQLVKREKAPG
jgi:uncharacterized protein (DUF697 family)